MTKEHHQTTEATRNTISRAAFGTIFLSFLHGVFITVIAVLFVNAEYDDKLFDQLVSRTICEEMTDEDKILSLLNTAHHILRPRHQDYFGGEEYINVRDTLFRSSDIQLIDGKGGCGSYTHVLARLLQRSGYTVRIAQMKCGDNGWGCHILLEVLVDGDWIVLDALYNLHFIDKQNNLASFREVGADWDYFKKQVPGNYNHMYAYEDVRYTNWNKIPVLMPLIKSILDLAVGDESENISLRAYALNVYRTYLIIALVLYTLLITWSVYAYWRGRSESIKAMSN